MLNRDTYFHARLPLDGGRGGGGKPRGANGNIGAEYVAKGAPDGSVVFLSSVGAIAISPSLYSPLPYDPVRDFAPAPVLADVLAGRVAGFLGDLPGFIGQIKGGKMKAIAVAAPPFAVARGSHLC